MRQKCCLRPLGSAADSVFSSIRVVWLELPLIPYSLRLLSSLLTEFNRKASYQVYFSFRDEILWLENLSALFQPRVLSFTAETRFERKHSAT